MNSRESDLSNKRLCECGCKTTLSRNKGRFIHGHNRRGFQSNYKRGWYKQNGYKYVLYHGHHRLNHGRYVLEHILVYEEYYKCCVLKTGLIHHINGIKDDNRIENLELMSKSKHNNHHRKEELSNGKILFGGKNRWGEIKIHQMQ